MPAGGDFEEMCEATTGGGNQRMMQKRTGVKELLVIIRIELELVR